MAKGSGVQAVLRSVVLDQHVLSAASESIDLLIRLRADFIRYLDLGSLIRITGDGSALGNTLQGTGGDDTLEGGSGPDVIAGLGGSDTLSGHGDADILDGGPGADILHGGDGWDELTGGAGDDELHGDTGVDILDGGGGNDHLFGGEHDDILWGGAGSDTLDGGTGVTGNLMQGGTGNDIYFVRFPYDLIIEDAGAGIDTVHVFTEGYGLGANVEIAIVEGVGSLFGNDIANTFYGDTSSTEIWTAGGNDVAYGAGGQDTLRGELGNDHLYGGDADDQIFGDEGSDWLYGDAGEDSLYGGLGSDRLYGGDDNDFLASGANNDTIDGEGGDDHVDGGPGVDRLSGGAGADTFFFWIDSLSLSASGGLVQRDTILDFSLVDGDRIDLSAIDAIAGGGDDAFTFVTRFTRTAGQAMLVYNAIADTTSLRLDVDGDGKIDHQIVINGRLLTTDDAWVL